jgi:hypothetical protein
MTFPPRILRECSGYLDILGYVEVKLAMGSQGRELFTSLLHRNRPCGSPGRIQEKDNAGTDRQHMAMWWCLISTQRQAQKLILGLSATAKVRVLSFNRIQSRVITGLLTGRNSLRRHLYLMGLIDSRLCRCGTGEETSAHVLSECEALATPRHTYLGSLFLDPENVSSLGLRAI